LSNHAGMVQDTRMRRQVPVWGGVIVAVVALTWLGVYLAQVGLEKADKLASVIGLFIAAVGLGVTVYGLIASRESDGVRQSAQASEHGRVNQAVGDINDRPAKPSAPASNARVEQTPRVWQRAKAAGSGQVNQAGGHINKP
jgi:high-affinity Fe2+/Pb2+ permease